MLACHCLLAALSRGSLWGQPEGVLAAEGNAEVAPSCSAGRDARAQGADAPFAPLCWGAGTTYGSAGRGEKGEPCFCQCTASSGRSTGVVVNAQLRQEDLPSQSVS